MARAMPLTMAMAMAMAIVKGMALPDGPAVPDAGQGTQPGQALAIVVTQHPAVVPEPVERARIAENRSFEQQTRAARGGLGRSGDQAAL
jgi:hypothetical protein